MWLAGSSTSSCVSAWYVQVPCVLSGSLYSLAFQGDPAEILASPIYQPVGQLFYNSLVDDVNAAIAGVQSQTETFGTNSGTIGTRQTFETALINTLQTGASNLVAADQNQESADLLTEQTQQQLEISALSIANQANQSVLKLFG